MRVPKGLDGDCQIKNDHYLIRIDPSLQEHEALDTLLHEWAHALSLTKSGDEHGSEWGIAYSKVYRAFLKHILIKFEDQVD